MSESLLIDQVLDFWFGTHDAADYGQPKAFWFQSTPEMDKKIADTFAQAYEQAAAGELDELTYSAEGSLTLVILLDQFPRNMFRGTPKAFATDARGLDVAKNAIKLGFDKGMTDFKCKFLYVPFMHSESLEDQDRGIELFGKFGDNPGLEYARAHRDIIAHFGRFPHRNVILGRDSTAEEIEFLKEPGSSF